MKFLVTTIASLFLSHALFAWPMAEEKPSDERSALLANEEERERSISDPEEASPGPK